MSTKSLTRSALPLAAASIALASAVPSAAALVTIGDHAQLFFNGSATARWDDNIFLQPANEESDLIFIFAPGVELNVGNRANANVNLYYREDFYRYQDNDGLDRNTSNIFLESFYNLARLSMQLSGSFQQLVQPDVNLIAPGGGGLVERNYANANFRAEYELTERTSIASGASASMVDFRDDFNGYFRDSESFSVPLNVYYALTPRFDLSAGYRFRHTRVDGRSNYDDHYGNLGIRGEVLPKLMGEARAGWQQRRVETGANYDIASFGLDFSHFLTPKITLLLGGYRDFETGGEGSAITATGGSLGARYTFNHLVSANAGVNYFQRDYNNFFVGNVRREDETMDFNVGVTYSPTVYVNLSAGYIFRTNDSTIPGFEFDNNIFNISAALRY